MNTLLVIDDTPDSIRLLLNFLSERGFRVLIASDGQDGIETATLAQPDLILLDVIMQDMDGFEVCAQLKSNQKTIDIPIIFMTVRAEIINIVKGFELGAADYITKPFEHEEVLARVNTHVKLHKLQLQLTQQKQQLFEQNQQLQEEINQRKQVEESLQTQRNSLAKRTDELSQANAELARAARLKDEFLANMSHELRTPLNAILGISEIFQEQTYGSLNNKQHKFMRTLEDSGRHLLALINDILDLSKIEADKLTLKIDTVSVNEVCQVSIRMIKEMAYKKQIQVSTTLDYAVDLIQADECRLKQILINLLSNAIKFTPKGGSIKLVVNGDAEHSVVNFSVQDTGIGIAQTDMKRLFEPFVQLDGSLNRAQEGAGLGLSLVYRWTKMHGGSISVKSDVGQGSCFTVSLPWQPMSQEKLSETEPLRMAHDYEQAPVKSRHSSAVILLAEDQETSMVFTLDYLTTLGYQVIAARDGVEAIEQTRAKHPDLLLMDIQMPVMNGLEAIQEIRADTDVAAIPIIALTALAMPGDKERCLEAGANKYLSRPVSMKKLVETIDETLDNIT
jgi:signal transduction histidine kinase